MKKNLILISLDTVRADIGYSGKFKTIERLRKKSVTFLNTVSSSPLTPVSHATVLTGLQPYNHGIRHLFKEKLNKKVKTLAQILKQRGYKTAAIVSCPGMNKWYGFSKGFDHYDDTIPKLADGSDPLKTVDVKKRGLALKKAEIVVDRAIEWINANENEKFFLFVHFFDTHWPYKVPKNFYGDNQYEKAVAYLDHCLELFFNGLKKTGLFKNSTIVCFSDHGEDLGGMYKNDKSGKKMGHPEEFGHGCLLYDQTQKTMLVIKDDKLPANKNIKQQVRLVDILPTILSILKISYNSRQFDGVSLVEIIKNNKNLNLIGYSETFYPKEQTLATGGKFSNAENKKSLRIDNKYKIIFYINSGKIELYDLEKDSNELINLIK